MPLNTDWRVPARQFGQQGKRNEADQPPQGHSERASRHQVVNIGLRRAARADGVGDADAIPRATLERGWPRLSARGALAAAPASIPNAAIRMLPVIAVDREVYPKTA